MLHSYKNIFKKNLLHDPKGVIINICGGAVHLAASFSSTIIPYAVRLPLPYFLMPPAYLSCEKYVSFRFVTDM